MKNEEKQRKREQVKCKLKKCKKGVDKSYLL